MHWYLFPQGLYIYWLYGAFLSGSIFFIFHLGSELSLISWKTFCKSKDNWFLLQLFEVGIRLRFLCRNVYVSKENECFDKSTTFLHWSVLYLHLFVIVCFSLKVFALFLEQSWVPPTNQCWFEFLYFFWLGMFHLVLNMVALAYHFIFGFTSTVQFDSLDL